MANNTGRPLDMRAQVLLMVLAATLLAGCGKRHDPGSTSKGTGSHRYGPPRRFPGAPHQLKKSDLTEAEQKYGIAPVPDDTVTYQPDVIVVGGGAEAIRSQDPNGFRWTIDGDAAHADELAPGKVFFMTGRAVGRVLDVRKEGADLIVTVGPVTLTEIIREAHIHIENMPIDFGNAIAYRSPDLPGQVVSGAALARPGAGVMPAMYSAESEWKLYRVQGAPGSSPPVTNPPDVSNLLNKNFKTIPYVSTSAIGIRVSANGGGLTVSAETFVHLAAPTLNVDIKIAGLGIDSASIELKGGAGLTWQFAAGSDVGMRANVDALLQPDTDFSIPVGGIGPVPLAITVRQRFEIKTGLGVRDSTLKASGEYTFTGGFGVDYKSGTWGVAGPTRFTSKQSMTRTGEGLSMGVTGLNLSNQVRVIAGIGIHGFAAGPYFSFTTAVGAFRSSAIGMIACNGATLVVALNGGVGYFIPKSVTALINSVLSLLNIKYRVTGQGGLQPSTPLTIINKTNQIGGCKPPDEDPPTQETLHGPV
ncbi:MAG: hypothetical protein ABJC66_10950 [Gammaproteobacteria bacterium]